MAKFPDSMTKLEMLYEALELLNEIKVENNKLAIWEPKGGSVEIAGKGFNPVHTENPNQWHDFIITLANLTNEGFNKKSLKKIVNYFGNTDDDLGSLGLIKYILNNSNNQGKIPIIYDVLNDLQIKRGQGKTHGGWKSPEDSLIEDAEKRLQDVTRAIEELIKVFKNLDLSK